MAFVSRLVLLLLGFLCLFDVAASEEVAIRKRDGKPSLPFEAVSNMFGIDSASEESAEIETGDDEEEEIEEEEEEEMEDEEDVEEMEEAEAEAEETDTEGPVESPVAEPTLVPPSNFLAPSFMEAPIDPNAPTDYPMASLVDNPTLMAPSTLQATTAEEAEPMLSDVNSADSASPGVTRGMWVVIGSLLALLAFIFVAR